MNTDDIKIAAEHIREQASHAKPPTTSHALGMLLGMAQVLATCVIRLCDKIESMEKG